MDKFLHERRNFLANNWYAASRTPRMTECIYSGTRVDRVYEKVLSWKRKEITKNPRNGAKKGRGNTFPLAQFNPSAVKEDEGRARLNGSMRKRGVFEVGWRRRSVKRRRGIRRSPARILVNVVALRNNRSASRSRVTTRMRDLRCIFPSFLFFSFSNRYESIRTIPSHDEEKNSRRTRTLRQTS